MTEKQRRFVDEYLIDLNIVQAAMRAGYSKNFAHARGHELLENVGVRLEIDNRLRDIADSRIAKAEEVMEYLTKVLRSKSEEESTRDRLKAAELLGRRYALFTDKLNVEGTGVVQIVDDIPGDKP